MKRRQYMRRFSVQRNVYYMLGAVEAMKSGKSKTEIVASGIENTIRKSTPVIIPGEIIVGFNFGEKDLMGDAALLPEDYLPEDNDQGWQIMRENGVLDSDTSRFFEICREISNTSYPVVKVEKTELELQSAAEWAVIGRCIDSSHSVIGYEKVLKKGFSGLLREVEEAEKKNGGRPLYDSAKMICSAACEMGERYSQKAQELLDSGDKKYQKADLEQIIAVCSRVPRYPASSFVEAVQALWFAHIINTWEDFPGANSLGRLDQILYPYYTADIEKRIITKEQAFEIICCLWIKLYRDYDVQQSCVGGTLPNGGSAVNDLSYMMLDATEQLNFIRCLSVRFSPRTEKSFLKRALEVVGHVQKGIPFFFNDDVLIPALIDKGISVEDAFDYTQLGCVETTIPGRSNPHATTGITNLLKAIEYVFGNGHSLMYPEYRTGKSCADFRSLKTYEQFYKAVLDQIYFMLDLNCSSVNKHRIASISNMPRPYKSLLTDNCIASGRDFNDGGAKYDYYQIMLGGIPNLADSLAAVKKFVFEERRYTLEELRNILVNNFPDEAVRAEFLNKAPKYGNDIDEVDSIAVDLMNKTCDMLDELSEKYGLSFHAQPFTFLWMIDFGKNCAASPDGRRKGEPIAYSCSSMQGRDFHGLTALLNSLAKLPSKRAAGTTSAIVEIDPKLFCDRNIDMLTDIILAAAKKGLCNVQFNVVDAQTLMDAQKHPEHYNNLAVRVSGFSQKFNLLSPELQDHIIGRTKHKCL